MIKTLHPKLAALAACATLAFSLSIFSSQAQDFTPVSCSGPPETAPASYTIPMFTASSANVAGIMAVIIPREQIEPLVGKTITSLYFYKSSIGPMTGKPRLIMWLGQTGSSNLGTSNYSMWFSIQNNKAKIVYDGNPLAEIGYGKGWQKFALDTPYFYNGSGNLVLYTLYENKNNPLNVRIEWACENASPCTTPGVYATRTTTLTSGNTPQEFWDYSAGRPVVAFDHTTSPCTTPTVLNPGLNVYSNIGLLYGNFSAFATAIRYLVVRTPGTTALNTVPTDGTIYTAGSTLGNGTVLAYSAATTFRDSVAQNAQYTYTIFAANDGCSGGPLYNATPSVGTGTAQGGHSYTWNANAGTAAGGDANNWTPVRNNPLASDTLIINQGGASIMNDIPSGGTFAKMVISNNTSLTIQSAIGNTILVGKELTVQPGCSLTVSNTAQLAFAAGNSPVATIAGTLTINGVTSTLNTTNSVTSITGTLNVAGTSTATGTKNSLFFQSGSVYNHNRNGGMVPLATYHPASTVRITGITSTAANWPAASKPGNVYYNCTGQTASVDWNTQIDTIKGSLTVAGTGTNNLRFDVDAINGGLVQTGGAIKTPGTMVGGDIALSGGTLEITGISLKIGGNYNQSAGHTFTSTNGTNTELAFNGAVPQTVTSAGAYSGKIGITVDNTAGVLLNSNFTINNAQVIIRKGTISGTGALVYSGLSSKLLYNGAGAQTTTDFEFPATSGPRELALGNWSSSGVTLHAPRTVHSLSLGTGKLNTTMTNLLSLDSAAGNSFPTPPDGSAASYVNGPLAVAVKAGSNTQRTFPIGDDVSFAKVVLGSFHTGNTPQTIIARVVNGPTGGTGDGNLNAARYFEVTGINAIQSSTQPTISLGYSTTDYIGNASAAFVNQSATANGSYTNIGQSASTDNQVTSNTTLPFAPGPNDGNYFVLSTPEMVRSWDGGAATGNWSDAANWFPDGVPSDTEFVRIGNNAVVNLDTNGAAYSLLIDTGVTLNVNAHTLAIDSFVTNNGTLHIGGGTLRLGPAGGGNKPFVNNGVFNLSAGLLDVNGRIEVTTDAAFYQSGGDIRVDGNAGGVPALSVPIGKSIVSFAGTTDTVVLNGGTLTIVDPHVKAHTFSGTKITVTTGHTLVFGDGISTDTGTLGYNVSIGSVPYSFGNVILEANAGGQNRFVNIYHIIVQGNLTIRNGAELRQQSAGFDLTLMGNLTIETGGTLTVPGYLNFGYRNAFETWATNAQVVNSTGTIRNAETGATANLAKLFIGNSSAGGVTFNTGDISYSESLTFGTGKLFMGGNTLIQLTGATIDQFGFNTGWIVGRLQKYSTTGPLNFTFPIGDADYYTPFFINAPPGSVTSSGNIAVSTATGPYGNIGTSSIVSTNSINRYFSVNALNGITFAPNSISVTMFWGPNDVPAGGNPVNYILGKYSNGTWTYPTVTDTSLFYIKAGNISSFSDFVAGATTPIPLPVRLLRLNAQNVGAKNRVDWETASEEPAGAFEIERSTDGNHFFTIGSRGAHGRASSYTHWDDQPATGVNYYRLRMYDASGKAAYSGVVLAVVNDKNAFALSVYPNPVHDKMTVALTGNIGSNALLTVTDISGRSVLTIPVSGSQTEADMSSLAPGTYFLRYIDAERSHTVKVTRF